MVEDHGLRLVAAARQGDQRALDELIASYLPLVYNIVGRALQGHADVDDVVQETMLKVVNGISGLRDPAAFRSWLVAIAMREIRDSRGRRGRLVGDGGIDEVQGIADPGADFVDLTILRLGLSDQRRETAEATRWLDEADRDLLALWWLEAAGQITRGELADALELNPAYAAVRVQRMKAQLETARTVVRAVWAAPRCGSLDTVIRDWDGQPSSVWRKRLARHVRECAECSARQGELIPAESLLAGIALVPLPMVGIYATAHAWSSRGADEASPGPSPRPSRRKPRARRSRWAASKPVAASVVLATACAAGAIAVAGHADPASPGTAQTADKAAAGVVTTPSASSSVSASPSPSISASRKPSAAATTRTTPSPSASKTKASPVYGQTVDTVDAAPDVNAKPAALPKRPDGTFTVTGKYSEPFKGSLGGRYLLFWPQQYVTVTGKGYLSIRYEIGWFNRTGEMIMPSWTGLKGKLFHVASGGGRRMDDTHPGETADSTWMGNKKAGYVTLPSGAQQMWNNEYFYLDGTVTLTLNQGYADYNLSLTPYTWEQVNTDINTAPNPAKGIVRYGLTRDTGTDAAPVPQYLTRATPAKPWTVPQHSKVTPTS
ncbi:sigma-70 family RNA polymerase sigma factor [Streptomyces sp. NPDC047081]|uniref:RNA polymerase sigma factor n=1 Tax=Streptomyces sp. NPDC047081 TaxID=3154706 RepID=UPI0033C35B04